MGLSPTPPPTPIPGPPSIPQSPNEAPPQGNTIQGEIALQEQLENETGLVVKGILGGLPVAEQNQEYFVVFDEAGDTGPEIIGKTQYRVSYLVDSKLNTSKPSQGSVSALNVTQNFEIGRKAVVRADNATVLNQNLTGEQSIYNVGTIKLIATTETGSAAGAYITTMSFVDKQGQDIITDAEDVSCLFNVDDTSDQTILGGNNALINYELTQKAISGSDFLTFTGNNTLTILQDTTVAGTRIVVQGNIFAQADFSPEYMNIDLKVILEFQDGGVGNFIPIGTNIISIPYGNETYYYPPVYSDNSFNNYLAGSKFRIRVERLDNSQNNILKIRGGNFRVRQEYLPGDVVIPGLNAAVAPYWAGSYVSFNPPTGSGYSILTASAEFSYFINNGFQAVLDPQSGIFDPNNDSVTFDPIVTDLEMRIGDEIRFEYNKNKVHKVINVEEFSNGGIAISVAPQISTGSLVDHFTYYRIEQDGGYLLLDVEKNNDVNEYQPFSGIILPKYPSENLQKQGDELIYQLKQAGIIEK